MLEKIGTTLASALGWFGSVVTAIFGEAGQLNALQDLILIGVVFSIVMLGIKVIRKVMWGA